MSRRDQSHFGEWNMWKQGFTQWAFLLRQEWPAWTNVLSIQDSLRQESIAWVAQAFFILEFSSHLGKNVSIGRVFIKSTCLKAWKNENLKYGKIWKAFREKKTGRKLWEIVWDQEEGSWRCSLLLCWSCHHHHERLIFHVGLDVIFIV